MTHFKNVRIYMCGRVQDLLMMYGRVALVKYNNIIHRIILICSSIYQEYTENTCTINRQKLNVLIKVVIDRSSDLINLTVI